MRKAALFALFLLLAGLGAGWAQNLDTHTAPKYLWIQTDTMRPDGNHEAYINLVKGCKSAAEHAGLYWLAESAFAGTANEIKFVMFSENAAGLEKAWNDEMKVMSDLARKDVAQFAQATAAVSSTRFTLAKFEPGLSLNAGKIDHSKLTRAYVLSYQTRPGTTPEFAALVKEMNAVSAKAGDPDAFLVYSIVSGEGYPGFIAVQPMNSLAELDKEDSPEIQAAFTPLVRQHLADVVKNTVVKTTSEIYVIDPMLSHPPQSYIAANPDFWQVKEEVVASTPAKKVKKEKPAALKEKQ